MKNPHEGPRAALGSPASEAEVLQVAPGADLDTIKKAYRRAALRLHPDLNPHPDAARRFRRITDAYRVLEAEARQQHPQAPDRRLSWDQRWDLALTNIGALVRRWPRERWSQVIDGLPAAVWVASALEVIAQAWTNTSSEAVEPTVPGLIAGLAHCADLRRRHPLPSQLARGRVRALEAAFHTVETRLRTLANASPRAFR